MSLLPDFGKFQAPKVAKIFIFDISKELNLQLLPILRVKTFEFGKFLALKITKIIIFDISKVLQIFFSLFQSTPKLWTRFSRRIDFASFTTFWRLSRPHPNSQRLS